MGHYTKLAVLAFRAFGLIILMYAVPIVLLGLLRMTRGVAATPPSSERSTFLAWLVYALAGVLLLTLAKPLGRVAARGLDAPRSDSPAA